MPNESRNRELSLEAGIKLEHSIVLTYGVRLLGVGLESELVTGAELGELLTELSKLVPLSELATGAELVSRVELLTGAELVAASLSSGVELAGVELATEDDEIAGSGVKELAGTEDDEIAGSEKKELVKASETGSDDGITDLSRIDEDATTSLCTELESRLKQTSQGTVIVSCSEIVTLDSTGGSVDTSGSDDRLK